MTNFTLIPSRYKEIPAFIKARIPAFECSQEYLMWGGMIDDLPGPFLATFASYILRLSRETETSDQLLDALSPIGDMLAWDDAETDVAISDEFFETLGSDCSTHVQSMMPPSVRIAFDAWATSA